MKKIFLIGAILSMLVSLRVNAESIYTSNALNALEVGNIVSIGAPISDVQILGCYTDVKDDGSVIFYGVTSGPPAVFFAYDLNERTIIDSHELKTESGIMAKISYGVDMGADGIINITTQSNSLFFRYNTNTKEMKCYGKIFGETAVMIPGYVDSEDNYYFGTYPNAKLIKYDKSEDKLVDLGVMIPSGNYVRSVGGYNDKVFMGGIGNPTTEWVKYDIKTGRRTVLNGPSLEGVFNEDDVETYYSCSTAGKYLLTRCQIANQDQYYMCVFDMEKEEWIDYIPGILQLHSTDFEDGYIYFGKNLGTKGRCIVAYNPETKEIKETNSPSINPASNIVSPKFVTLKDQEKYPGRTLVAGSGNHGVLLVNFELKKREFIKEDLLYNNTSIRTLKAGIDDELVVSAYMGSKFVVMDTKTDSIKYEGNCSQIERIEVIDGKYYFGLYGTDAGIKEFNPVTKEDPVLLGKMTDADQDRAFNIVDAGDKIIWGSYPYYGKLGGAVAVYNKTSKTVDVYKEPIENQSIAGLAYRNGKIYGSTSVYGGLGIDAIDAPANLFIMDIETGVVELSREVVLKTDSNRQYFVGDMIFDKNGNLWAATAKTLLKINPETLEITDEITIGTGSNTLEVTRALPYCMEIGKDGLLYTNIGKQISAVDLSTKEVKLIAPIYTNAMTLCDDGNIYIISNSVANNVDRIEITRNVEDTEVIFPEYSATVKFESDGEEPITVINHNGEEETIEGKYVLLAARLNEFDKSNYSLFEHGLLVSNSDDKVDIENCYVKVPSLLDLTIGNTYGMLIYNLLPNTTYYLRPYAIFEDLNGTEYRVYGQTVTHNSGE